MYLEYFQIKVFKSFFDIFHKNQWCSKYLEYFSKVFTIGLTSYMSFFLAYIQPKVK